jgi:bacteriorhodopsin
MIAYSIVMLVAGYIGEVLARDNAAFWGFVSGAAYFLIVYEIWLGEASKLAAAAGGEVLKAHKILCWFILVGWAIYPLGYMMGTTGWYNSFIPEGNIDVVYNIGDAINKIGFGLVIYTLASKSSKD